MLPQFWQIPSGQCCHNLDSHLLVNSATATFWSMLPQFWQMPSGQCCYILDSYLLANVATIWTYTFWSKSSQFGQIHSGQCATIWTDTFWSMLPHFGQILTFWSILPQFCQIPSGQCCHNLDSYLLVNVATVILVEECKGLPGQLDQAIVHGPPPVPSLLHL